ncbi:hypothetical protein OSTOST_15547, partial [Ostertagia ostertagi]
SDFGAVQGPEAVHSKMKPRTSQESFGKWDSIMRERPSRRDYKLRRSRRSSSNRSKSVSSKRSSRASLKRKSKKKDGKSKSIASKRSTRSHQEKSNQEKSRSSSKKAVKSRKSRRPWRMFCKTAKSESSKKSMSSRNTTPPASPAKLTPTSQRSLPAGRSSISGSTKRNHAKSKQRKIQGPQSGSVSAREKGEPKAA